MVSTTTRAAGTPRKRGGKHAPRIKRAAGTPPARRSAPVLERDDLQRALLDLSGLLAPADVAAVMGQEAVLRARAAALPTPQLALLRDQLAVALDCLRDHVAGKCPQIPYSTISLLAAAVSYFADELDLVPDFLHIGRLDDGAAMALAFQLAADGVRRYCTATGRDPDAVLAPATGRHQDP